MIEVEIEQEAMDVPSEGAADRPAGHSVAARLLRGMGAAVLVASLSVFLLQGWGELGDLGRYALLLGQTVLLMATGFACAHGLDEPKGARVFVAIALAGVVANFAVLGALIWSQFQWLGALGSYPGSMAWRAVSGAWALAMAAGALVLLAPLTRIGFTILARHSARALTGLFLGSCALLLVPVRDPWAVGVLVALAWAAFAALARRAVEDDPGLRTLEGGFGLCLVLAPVGVALGRGLLFYPGGDVPLAAVATLGFAVLREGALRLVDGRWPGLLDRTGAAAAVAAALGWAEVVAVRLDAVGAFLPIFGLVAGGLLGELSTRAHGSVRAYRLLAGMLASGSVAANAVLTDSLLAAAIALVVGVAVAAQAVAKRHGWLLLAALVAGIGGLGDMVALAVGSVEIGAWGWLALIGTAAVLAGSALERGTLVRVVAAWGRGESSGSG